MKKKLLSLSESRRLENATSSEIQPFDTNSNSIPTAVQYQGLVKKIMRGRITVDHYNRAKWSISNNKVFFEEND